MPLPKPPSSRILVTTQEFLKPVAAKKRGTMFIKKKVEIAEPEATMTFRPGQFRRPAFSLETKNIVFVGLRGSGKTTVGRRVAERLGCLVVDTDDWVEERVGMRIADFVAAHGWPAFREVEEEVMVRACALPGKVVATGGGAVLSDRNRALWNAQAVVFYLAADIPLLLERLAQGDDPRRPALTHLPLAEELAVCLREREPLYMAVMDHLLQACRSPDELVEDVLVALGLVPWDGVERQRLMERW